MRKFSLQDSWNPIESLERKLSLSSLTLVGSGRPSLAVPVIIRPLDDDPPPDPEPGPPSNPPSPPYSGPSGPG
jgi:hypothetical protein